MMSTTNTAGVTDTSQKTVSQSQPTLRSLECSPAAQVEKSLDIEKRAGENTNNAHRAVLKECRTDFSCRLSPLAPVISELYSRGIITEFQKQDLELPIHAEYKHTLMIFDILEQKDEQAFATFCDILVKTEHEQLASILCEKLHCIKAQKGADLLELKKSKKNGNGEEPPPMPSKQDDTSSLSSVKKEPMPVATETETKKWMPEKFEGTKTSSPKSSNAEEFKTIAELSHLNKTWTTPIRCRVSHKTSIRPFYDPEQVDSQIFEVRIVDESGTISAYSWNQLCDDFFNKFEVNQVCTIVGGELKAASLEFEKSNHNSCIYLTTATKVLDYKELPTAPLLSFNLTKLSDISKKEDNTSIDVIGIVVRVAEKRSTNVMDVIFADDTGYLVPLQLILNDARISAIAEKKILLIRDCCVKNWYSPYLIARLTSTVAIDPEIPEALSLRNYFQPLTNLARFLRHGLTESGVTLEAVNELPKDGQTIVTVKATVFGVDLLTYKGCPMCTTSLEQDYCIKCKRSVPDSKTCTRLKVKLKDTTNQKLLVACFAHSAETMLRTDVKAVLAAELADKGTGEQKESNVQRIAKYADNKEFAFRITAKLLD